MLQAPDSATETLNPKGAGPVVLLCEHASNHIPSRFAGLGLTPAQQASHIAWDPGAREICLRLSNALDAPLVASPLSRLVYDCNRPPEHPGAMTARSEATEVPGNSGLGTAERAARVEAAYRPFCAAVDTVLDRRAVRALPTALVTIHSFTPHYLGQRRDVEIGILHDSDSRLADAMLARAAPGRDIRRNTPYGPEDGVTHSLVRHGIARGLLNVMIELRSDLIADTAGVAALSDEVLSLLAAALDSLRDGTVQHA